MSKRLEQDVKLRQEVAHAIGRRKDPEFMRFSKLLDSGYTYLGQLISHDIVAITDPLQASRDVSGTFDLESIYGNRQNYQLQHITDNDLLFTTEGYFKFATDAKLDFQRNAQGIALIPEQRNDDHIIIAQLHMFWQRLHNLFIKRGYAADALGAKRLVVLTCQLMVIEDYLREILDDDVYHRVFDKQKEFLTVNNFWLDVFRFATFRFGHSSIRNSYSLRLINDDPMPSRDLLELFMNNREPRKINDDDYIDWRAFFCMQGRDQFEGMLPIDTCICGFMSNVPMISGLSAHIANRNIASELAADLPNGIEIAELIESKLPKSLQSKFIKLANEHIEDASFNHLGLAIEDLTIWMYILLEAQLAVEPHKLGIVASSVNAHVIQHAIEQAKFSVYQQGKYSFGATIAKMGSWGEELAAIAKRNRKHDVSKLCMKDLVNFLTDNE